LSAQVSTRRHLEPWAEPCSRPLEAPALGSGRGLAAALVVLERADGLRGRGRGLVFPGIQGKMVGAAVFGRLLRDLGIDSSPHGFRSSFRSWCSDQGIDRELAEQALAHAVGSQVEQCYARSDVLERRREVMEAWGAFLAG